MVFLAIFLIQKYSAIENRKVSSAPFISLKPLTIQGDSITEAKTLEKSKMELAENRTKRRNCDMVFSFVLYFVSAQRKRGRLFAERKFF